MCVMDKDLVAYANTEIYGCALVYDVCHCALVNSIICFGLKCCKQHIQFTFYTSRSYGKKRAPFQCTHNNIALRFEKNLCYHCTKRLFPTYYAPAIAQNPHAQAVLGPRLVQISWDISIYIYHHICFHAVGALKQSVFCSL